MGAANPGDVISQDRGASVAKLGIERAEPGDAATSQVYQFAVCAAERLDVGVNPAGCETRQDGVIRLPAGATVAWSIEDRLDAISAKAHFVDEIGRES